LFNPTVSILSQLFESRGQARHAGDVVVQLGRALVLVVLENTLNGLLGGRL